MESSMNRPARLLPISAERRLDSLQIQSVSKLLFLLDCGIDIESKRRKISSFKLVAALSNLNVMKKIRKLITL
jgi:hypothetical protein